MGEKVGNGRGAVMVDEMSEGMQCNQHPYRTNPSGICAFCLQEKLGKLVSSSKFSDPFFSLLPPPSSSSTPPSFPSTDLPSFPSSTRNPFLSAKPCSRKMKPHFSIEPTGTDSSASSFLLNRSKSVIQQPRGEAIDSSYSPRKKSFWSFFTLSYSSPSPIPIPTSFTTKRRSTSCASSSSTLPGISGSELPKVMMDEHPAGVDDSSPSGSHASSSFGRKVARSRSVGCGSRTFSGDFLERISNGFGDCTLRRVESHRETKQKPSIQRFDHHGVEEGEHQIKERIKCGGIFVGLGMSTYWISAMAAANACRDTSRFPSMRRSSSAHGRSKSWNWAFASPMRVFRPAGGSGQSTIITTGLAGGG